MDLETGCVDILFEKPGPKVGRDHRGPGLNPTVVKVIKGTDVSKNKAKLLSNSVFEDLSPEVCYSLKKKNRWQQLHSVHSVLTTVAGHSPSFNVSAVEKNLKYSRAHDVLYTKGIQVYGRVKAGADEAETIWTVSKTGSSQLSLEDSLECRNGKNKKKEKGRPRDPEVIFVIERETDTGRPSSREANEYRKLLRRPKKTHRARNFLEGFSDEEDGDSLDESVTGVVDETVDEVFDGAVDAAFDEAVEENSKQSFKLCEFVKDPSPKKKKVHQKKIKDFDFVDQVLPESRTHQKPLNEQEILKNSSFFSKEVDLCSFFLRPELFVENLEDWAELNKEKIKIMWLDEDKTKCFIDFSRILLSKNLIAVVGFTLLGKKQRFLRITFNTAFSLQCSNDEFKKFSKAEKQFSNFFDYIVEFLRVPSAPVVLKNKKTNIKEAYPFTCAPTVDSVGDCKLLETLSEVRRSPASESSFELVHSDSCGFCGHRNPSDLVRLSCTHPLCLCCARASFKHQVVDRSKELVCPICECPQDPLSLVFVIPLPLVKAFVKERFEKIWKNGIQNCPECFGSFEKVPEALSVRCKNCCVAFCQTCLQPPHFPISCDQMKLWLPKFEHHYNFHLVKEAPAYGCCPCGSYVPLETTYKHGYSYATCGECKKLYYSYTVGDWNHYCRGVATNLKVLKPSEIPVYFGKNFMDPCVEARNEIKNVSKTSEIRRNGREFLSQEDLDQLISLRFQILKLIEHGTAWLYFERENQNCPRNKEISKTLKNLKLLLDSVSNQIINKSGSRIQDNFIALQELYSKALSMF